MKQKLLIINKNQFGYHTDYYKYCEYLKSEYSITFLSFNSGKEKLIMEGVSSVYAPRIGPKYIKALFFFLICIVYILNHQGVVFIHYFEKCELLKLIFKNKKFILDIRTLSVDKNPKEREVYNNNIKKSARYFDYVTVVSNGVKNILNLREDRSSVLPLGSDIISNNNKDYSKFNLLYVGTLTNRNISDTIIGLKLFIDKYGSSVKIKYNIIGDGDDSDDIDRLVQELGLNNIVSLHGRLPHFKLEPFFEQSSIGVSYIPITDYYQFQPPTKTFEYILSGLICIGTQTYENLELINSDNGILCKDTPEAFCMALSQLYKTDFSIWNTDKIRSTLIDHTWENIVNKKLKSILYRLEI